MLFKTDDSDIIRNLLHGENISDRQREDIRTKLTQLRNEQNYPRHLISEESFS